MQAQTLCKQEFVYLKGSEYIGTIEEVEIEIETKVTLRQESHQNR